MGKKYIIEIPDDKIGDFIGSTHFLMPYMMAGHIGHHDTGLPIEPYTVPDFERVKEEAYAEGYKEGMQLSIDDAKLKEEYKRGLADAWEASRKIGCGTAQGGFSPEMMRNVFGTSCFSSNVFRELTASEAIEKIKAWEEKRREQEIKVWDEIQLKTNHKIRVCVVKVEDGNFDGFTIAHPDNKNIGNVWAVRDLTDWERTGRHFDEIASVFEKMKKE